MGKTHAQINAPGRRCGRCGVQFVNGPPPRRGPPPRKMVSRAHEAGDTEWLRCPDCGLRFWADPAGGAGGRCLVGLSPEDAP